MRLPPGSFARHVHKNALVGRGIVVRVACDPLGDLVRVAAEDALHLLVFRLLLGDLLVQRFQLRTLGADGDLIGNVGCQHAEQHQHKKQPDQRFAKRTLPALFAANIFMFVKNLL